MQNDLEIGFSFESPYELISQHFKYHNKLFIVRLNHNKKKQNTQHI